MPLTPAERFAALSPDEQAAAMLDSRDPSTSLDPPVEARPAPPEQTLEPGYFDLQDVWDDTLDLTFRGKTYTLHAPDIDTGLLCQRVVGVGLGAVTGRNTSRRESKIDEQIAGGALDDDAEEELYVLLLGGDPTHPGYRADWDVWQQLRDDAAPWPLVQLMGVTALWWTGVSRDFALDYWRTGGRPKDPTPLPVPTPRQPQDRKMKAGASTTPRRASGSSTRPKKAAGKGTSGPKS